MCKTQDGVNRTRDFSTGGLWFVSWLVTLPCATSLFLKKWGVAVSLALVRVYFAKLRTVVCLASGGLYFVENKFCLKCGNCSVQVAGVLMIYCVCTEYFSAYFD